MNYLKLDQACTLLRLRLSSNSDSALAEQAAAHIGQNPLLVLDATGLSFNSMQIGELLNIWNQFKSHWAGRAHSLALINLTPQAWEVFKTAKLSEVFQIYETLGDALDGFAAGEPPAKNAAG